jgi:hypothetical protein
MRQVIKQLIRKDNMPAYAAIAVSVAGIFLTEKSQQIAIFGILGLIAVNTITERVTYFGELMGEIRRGRAGLRSRHEGDFVDFENYIRDGHEVYVAGLSLDFICTNRQRCLRNKDTEFRFVIVDPASPEPVMEKFAEHDERLSVSAASLRAEIERTMQILTSIKRARADTAKPLTVKAGHGIPVCTVTMVDASRPTGKIRVEFRPYRQNFSPRPYLEFRRDSVEDSYWYDHFYRQYYVQLWNDSSVIPL